MLFTLDTEFLEDGHTIELISIGLCAANGNEYYAINSDAPWKRVLDVPWMVDNVVKPHLPHTLDGSGGIVPDVFHPDMKPRSVIAEEVKAFFWDNETTTPSETWAWWAAYDHVVLCQLWGRMIEVPRGVPKRTNCLRQEYERQLKRMGQSRGKSLPFKQEPKTEHHALGDARFDMQIAYYLGVAERLV
jgi:hypothetical protein